MLLIIIFLITKNRNKGMYEINIDINNITRYFNKYIDKF